MENVETLLQEDMATLHQTASTWPQHPDGRKYQRAIYGVCIIKMYNDNKGELTPGQWKKIRKWWNFVVIDKAPLSHFIKGELLDWFAPFFLKARLIASIALETVPEKPFKLRIWLANGDGTFYRNHYSKGYLTEADRQQAIEAIEALGGKTEIVE